MTGNLREAVEKSLEVFELYRERHLVSADYRQAVAHLRRAFDATGAEKQTPTDEEFEQAEDRVDKWLQGRLEGQSYMAKELCPLIGQLCRDLNEAHNEILRQQGVAEADYGKFDWPEWTPQANSIRWAEKILKVRLAKTDNWTLYPATVPAAD